MAMYHLSVKYVSRGQGRSAVGAAAYRSGEKLYNDYDGLTHDYTAKKGIVYSEIILPDNAPDDYYNRQNFWNAVEKSEKRSDARTAREIEIALPLELSKQQQIELVRDYIRNNFINLGMGADFSLHSGKHTHYIDTLHEEAQADKIITPNNPHAHILLTTRPIGSNGLSVKKNRNWDKSQNVTKWREKWAQIQNKEFERLGIESRVDHRSNKDRELEQEPTIHEGSKVRRLEESGIKTKIGDINREIKRRNQEKLQIKQELQKEQRRSQELTENEKRFTQQKQEIQNAQKAAKLRLETIEKNKHENSNVPENSSTYSYKKSEILQGKTDINANAGDINHEIKPKQESQNEQKTAKPQPETIKILIKDIKGDITAYPVNHNVSENSEPQLTKTEQRPKQKLSENEPNQKIEEKQHKERRTGGEREVPITDRFNKEQEKAEKQWNNTFGADIDKTNIIHAEKRDIFGNVVSSYHKAPEEIQNQPSPIKELQEEKVKLEIEKLKLENKQKEERAKLEIEKLQLEIAEKRQRLQQYERQRPNEPREKYSRETQQPLRAIKDTSLRPEVPTQLRPERETQSRPERKRSDDEIQLRPERAIQLRQERETQLREEKTGSDGEIPLRPERPRTLR
jgi:hypothetical protein